MLSGIKWHNFLFVHDYFHFAYLGAESETGCPSTLQPYTRTSFIIFWHISWQIIIYDNWKYINKPSALRFGATKRVRLMVLLVLKIWYNYAFMCRFDKICFLLWQSVDNFTRRLSVTCLWTDLLEIHAIACIWSSTRSLAADSKKNSIHFFLLEDTFCSLFLMERKKKSEKLKANDSENLVVLDERNNCVRSTIYCLILVLIQVMRWQTDHSLLDACSFESDRVVKNLFYFAA